MESEANGGGGGWAAPDATTSPPGWSTDQPPPSYPTPPGQGAPRSGYAAPPPPRPGIVPLRPLGVGELLDGAFTAIRRYPRATLGLAACVMLVVTVVQVAVQWSLLGGLQPPAPDATLSDAGDYASRLGTAATISFVVTAAGTLLLTGLVTAVIGEGVLGRPVTASDAWRRLRPLLWRLVAVTVLTFVLVALVAAVGAVPGIVLLAADVTGGAAVLAVGVVVSVLAAAWLYVSLTLAPAALVLERQTVRGAMRRSRALVKGNWWRIVGILLLAGVLATVVGGIISLPFGLAGGGLTTIGDDRGSVGFSELVINGVGGLIASTVVRPFSAGVAALLYIDRRMRAEALDLALVRAAAEDQPG